MKIIIIALTLFSFSALASTDVFKMYADHHVTPNPNCDVHVELKLKIRGNRATATLTNSLAGYCEIYVIPNVRTYQLVKIGTSCGSTVYAGINDRNDTLNLTDNRTRICDDIIPALIGIEENGFNYYSHDQQ